MSYNSFTKNCEKVMNVFFFVCALAVLYIAIDETVTAYLRPKAHFVVNADSVRELKRIARLPRPK